jgi:tetratricopeptide (TPR) repeat protein
MVFRPEVFVSATPKELGSFRSVVKATLREIGALPVEHTDRSLAYGPLDGVLKVAIGRCDVVIHLTGFAFGAEPPERTHGAPRRSTAQYEFDVAQKLRRELLCFVARSGTLTDSSDRGDDEARMLQNDHRRMIERGEHWAFSSPDELAQLIRALRPRIMLRRRYVRLPFAPRYKQFFGRERQLTEVREAFERSSIVVLEPPPKFATSSASAGKTALAVEAAWRLYETGRFDFVFYLPAVSGAELETELAALTHMDALALVKDEIAGHRLRLHAMRSWFRADEHAGRFLVVLDGVDHESTWLAIESMLPWLARGAVLITTRMPRPIEGAERIGLGAISTEASVALLAAQLFQRPLNPAEHRSLEQLAATLAHQPLALQLAARAMAETGQTPAQFLAAVTAEGEAVSEDGAPRVVRWQPVLAGVVRRSIARLEPTARAFLHVLVSLAPQPSGIPQAIFASRTDAAQTRTALGQLERLGLIALADEGHTVLVHRLVREIVRDRLTPEENAAALDAGRALIEAALQRTEHSATGAALRDRVVTHCRVLLGQLNGHPLEANAGHLAHGLAAWLRDCGRLSEAEHFQRRALRIAEQTCAADHPDLAPELRSLAVILQGARRFRDAVELHRRAVAILEPQPASHTSELIAELYALAACLRAASRLREAEPVLREALALEERQSGRSHPRTAIAAHALGALLEILHRPADAVPLYRRALEIDEQLPHCPPGRLALRLHHLASAIAASGDHYEAIALHQRALSLDDQAFGPLHTELAAPLKEVAALFEIEGRWTEAEALLRRALKIEEQSETTAPLEMACTLTSLAAVLTERGDLAEAEPHIRRALGLLDDEPRWHPLVRALRSECEALLAGPQDEPPQPAAAA